MSDLLARLDSMIEALTKGRSSRCSRSTAAAQTPTGTDKPLDLQAFPGVPAKEQDILRDADISRTQERSRQHTRQGKAPLGLSPKSAGTTGVTGTGEDFCGVERSRNVISNGNNENTQPKAKIPHATLEEGKRTVPSADFIAVGSPPNHGAAATELLKDDLVAQSNAHHAAIVDVRRQPRCGECQEPITAEVSDWLGGLPVHHSCGIAAWRREWGPGQQKDDDDEHGPHVSVRLQ